LSSLPDAALADAVRAARELLAFERQRASTA